MKKVMFDLQHPVDVNFFKNAINILIQNQVEIDIVFRPRGKLGAIARYELPIEPIAIGKHYKGFFAKLFGQFIRDFKLFRFYSKKNYSVIACFGPTSAISARFKGIPYLAFDDDFEYKIPFYHANIFATKHIYPDFIKYSNKKVVKYHGYKELAYLHPNYFKPDIKNIAEYGIEGTDYIFIRHISSISLNYKGERSDLKILLDIIRKYNYKIVLSIEDKSLVPSLGDDIIVLKEPIKDIYSLMYFSTMAISFGDTVARECAILGVPVIYLGGRNMFMHEELVKAGIMIEATDLSEIELVLQSDLPEKKRQCKGLVEAKINTEWADTTKVILNQIAAFIK